MNSKKRAWLFKNLIEPQYDRLYYFICSRVGDRQLAGDLLQNTMEKGWRMLERLEDYEKASSWITQIAANEIRLHFRNSGAKKRSLYHVCDVDVSEMTDIDDGAEDILEALIEKEAGKYIIEALESLEEKYRLILTLRHIHEMTFSEISETVKQGESTVKARYKKGLVLLREACEKIEKGGNEVV